ncbi:RagB/SusD family nutrient uptake outer membrane protein [Dyadobacter psychrotolerans]|uniref:RagB/SusD family nutrient uptake outer membrane protein n=1 Tax=Dyadobacter psychrotolerans TaxID=2541721 RepID=A0A4R5DVG6_9BACT|nr:RagB/SusD family nutrient uptake outer membrane protein [Dyadobacter psychrotolerans]TDE18546.1 RagB/SusD family nutrient uptake outer membrane protein [Dyadobacter psychrotolerans]
MKKRFIFSILTAGILTFTSCEQKEYLNPSSASEMQVITDVNGLITLANGLQYRYTVSAGASGALYSLISANGLTTKELLVLNAGNTDLDLLSKGSGNVQGNNATISTLWAQSHLTKSNADIILKNLGIVSDASIKSGLTAYASIFKALSLGALAEFWQQAPIGTGKNITFNSREDVLKEAVTVLESAATAIATNAPSAEFTSRVVNSVDMPNTIQALIARYSLMLGQYDKALAAANKVDLTKKSAFNFDDVSQNPIFFLSFGNRNVTEPINTSLGLPDALKPAVADKRVAFYTQTAAPAKNLGTGFFTANNAAVPVYLPGEIMLIKAEVLARQSKFDESIAELNKVLTKTTDVWGLGAGLPAYSGAKDAASVLTEIYRNRCIELFMSGLKLEDSRRFARPETERNRTWYPYPTNERQNNTSTPADPAN